jgi:hypothetical protein
MLKQACYAAEGRRPVPAWKRSVMAILVTTGSGNADCKACRSGRHTACVAVSCSAFDAQQEVGLTLLSLSCHLVGFGVSTTQEGPTSGRRSGVCSVTSLHTATTYHTAKDSIWTQQRGGFVCRGPLGQHGALVYPSCAYWFLFVSVLLPTCVLVHEHMAPVRLLA